MACLLGALSACASGERIEATAPVIPASLRAPCAAPVALPEGAMSEAAVEVAWGRDRDALRTCGSRHEALVGEVAQ